MSTYSLSLKLMMPSRPGPFEGILKLKTAHALTRSVAERIRSDSAKNMARARELGLVQRSCGYHPPHVVLVCRPFSWGPSFR